jgi:hypothetical protein
VQPAVQIYSQEPGYVVAVAGKYLIQVMRDRTTTTTISLVRRALADLAERHPTFGYLCILEPEAQLTLAPAIREGVDAYIKRYTSRLTGVAVVFEKGGFQGTAVRSVMTAVNVATRATHPSQVFDKLPEAVSWLNRLTLGELTTAGLIQIAKQLRSTA